jgi:hypothetical protein
MLGVRLMDIINGLFITIEVDPFTPNLLALPCLYFHLTFIDWNHPFLMALLSHFQSTP